MIQFRKNRRKGNDFDARWAKEGDSTLNKQCRLASFFVGRAGTRIASSSSTGPRGVASGRAVPETLLKGLIMTVASKLKTAGQKIKTATKKVVRKTEKALKPVGDALHLSGKKHGKTSTTKKPAAAKRAGTKKAH